MKGQLTIIIGIGLMICLVACSSTDTAIDFSGLYNGSSICQMDSVAMSDMVQVANVSGEQDVTIDFLDEVFQTTIINGTIERQLFLVDSQGRTDSLNFRRWAGSLSQSDNGTILSIELVEGDTLGNVFQRCSFLGER